LGTHHDVGCNQPEHPLNRADGIVETFAFEWGGCGCVTHKSERKRAHATRVANFFRLIKISQIIEKIPKSCPWSRYMRSRYI
jgi:hypothetical protein